MIAIKARFEKQVRRVSFEKEDLSFSELTSTISQLFKKQVGDSEVFKYLDDEGEWVDLSSDLELREAVRLNKGKTLQLVLFTKRAPPQPRPFHCRREQSPFWFVQQQPQPASPQPKEPEQPSNPQGFVHAAFCDSCNSRIVGIRHKCAECPDYDLCNKCIEKKGQVHDTQHTFKPLEKSQSACLRGAPAHPFRDFFANLAEFIEKEANQEKKEEEQPVAPSSPVASEAKVDSPVPTEEKKEEVQLAPIVEEPVEQIKEEEKEQPALSKDTILQSLTHLESMGFNNREENIQALLRNKGNLPATVAQLLD